MSVKNTLGKRAGLEEREAQEDRIAHAGPDSRADILSHDHVPDEDCIDCNADNNKKSLESERA